MKAITLVIISITSLFFITKALAYAKDPERITQILVAPPNLPVHDQSSPGQAKIVQMSLTIEEKELEIDDGVFLQAMTFNGSVPGPMIVVHQNDYVELTLINPSTNTMQHNIDFHAATGALGGGTLTLISPGEQATLRFKATKSGVFVYHCAPGGSNIPYHVVSGMNGAIMVLPRNGLRNEKNQPITYDKAYYIGEQDFYLPKDSSGEFIRYQTLADARDDTIELMTKLIPSRLVFNGRVGALTGANALTASVGEKVLFIHSQANRDSRPHLIGGHADLVWPLGSFDNTPAKDIETWFVPGGSAVAAFYEFRQPGLYAYVNHNLIEAVMLGALATINVSGVWDNDLMEQISAPGPIVP